MSHVICQSQNNILCQGQNYTKLWFIICPGQNNNQWDIICPGKKCIIVESIILVKSLYWKDTGT